MNISPPGGENIFISEHVQAILRTDSESAEKTWLDEGLPCHRTCSATVSRKRGCLKNKYLFFDFLSRDFPFVAHTGAVGWLSMFWRVLRPHSRSLSRKIYGNLWIAVGILCACFDWSILSGTWLVVVLASHRWSSNGTTCNIDYGRKTTGWSIEIEKTCQVRTTRRTITTIGFVISSDCA